MIRGKINLFSSPWPLDVFDAEKPNHQKNLIENFSDEIGSL